MPQFPEQYAAFVILAPIAVLVTVGVILYAWRYRRMWETSALLWLMVTIVGWLVFNTAELIASGESQTLLWAKICYAFIAVTPVAWLLFALRYSGQRAALAPRYVLLYHAIPIITTILALTNDAHGLLWQAYHFAPVYGMLTFRVTYGPWFWVHVSYSYVLVLVGAVLIVRRYVKSFKLYRQQSYWMAIGALTPIVANLIHVSRPFPQLQKDYTPISFALAGLALAVGMLRYRLFDLKPIARDVVLDRMPDAALIVDLLGRIVDLNPAAQRLTMLTPETIIGRPLTEVIPAWSAWSEILKERDELQVDLVLDYGGEPRDYEAQISVLRDPQKNRNGWVVLLHDVTERKRAEAVSRLRLQLVELSADHSPEELMQHALDEIGALTHSTIGFYHAVEAGQPHQPVSHDDYTTLSRHGERSPEHVEVERELVIPTVRDGRVVSILGVGNKPADYSKQDVELVTFAADVIWSIVERKRAEEQLQAYQRQLEAQNLELRKLSLAIEQSGSIVVITDAEGSIEYANPRFEETTGYTVREALGQNPRLLKSGEQSADFYRELWETIASGQIWRGEFHNRRKDGSLYWESATITPVLDGDGQVTHYIAVKEDITARKAAEDALRHYAEQLAMQNAELDAFAHTVAHDLKNPLSVVMGYASLLEGTHDSLSPDALHSAIEKIARYSEKLDNILEELLLLAGVRKQKVAPVPLAMGDIVREACERLRLLFEQTGAEIRMPEPTTWPTALGYGPWVEQVWVNYISNALKYGGEPPRVELGYSMLDTGSSMLDAKELATGEQLPASSIELPASSIQFWVRDNGAGLTPEEQASLFTPFTRLEQARVEGHGLGLSIVQRIVEKLGGQVGVESAEGVGSTFWFSLPAAPPSSDPVE